MAATHNQDFAARKTTLAGCFELQSLAVADARGFLVKSYAATLFKSLNIDTDFQECFYTCSGPRVLRGMHFQLPPADHAKLVYSVSGAILDVALDLRVYSPSYRQHEVFRLDAERHNAVYLPSGVAHGFYVTRSPAVVMYHVSSEHVPELDRGIAWNSFGFHWPDPQPVLSERDRCFIPLDDFDSPFRLPGNSS